MNFDLTMRSIQRAVSDAGGEWIGIQESLKPGEFVLPELVFRHPRTKKIITYPFNPISVDESALYANVLKLIADDVKSDPEPYVSVTVAKLRTLARHLAEIQAELEALLERKKS